MRPRHPFPILFVVDLPEGRCVGLQIPSAILIDPDLVDGLLEEERDYARQLHPNGRPTWIAGRLALRHALRFQGIDCGPLLATPRGAPLLPEGSRGSISHKADVAVAIASADEDWTLGIDLELLRKPRFPIERRALRAEEREAIAALSETDRWKEALVRFSIKEAVYKAIDPYLQRYVGFHEVSVWPSSTGEARVQLELAQSDLPLRVIAQWRRVDAYVLSTARACVVAEEEL